MSTLKILRRYVAEGFLLHGSRKKFDVVEPRKANDDGHYVCNQFGVYATDDVRIPLVMALIHPTDPNDVSLSYHSQGDGPLQVNGRNICLRPGYIYVLPPNTFEKVCADGNTEIISPTPVIPITVVKVDPGIFLEVPDIKLPEFLR